MGGGGGGGGWASVCFFFCVSTSYVMCSLFRYDAKSVMEEEKFSFPTHHDSFLHMLSARATICAVS